MVKSSHKIFDSKILILPHQYTKVFLLINRAMEITEIWNFTELLFQQHTSNKALF